MEHSLNWPHGVADNLDQIHNYLQKEFENLLKYYQSADDEVDVVVKVTPVYKKFDKNEYYTAKFIPDKQEAFIKEFLKELDVLIEFIERLKNN